MIGQNDWHSTVYANVFFAAVFDYCIVQFRDHNSCGVMVILNIERRVIYLLQTHYYFCFFLFLKIQKRCKLFQSLTWQGLFHHIYLYTYTKAQTSTIHSAGDTPTCFSTIIPAIYSQVLYILYVCTYMATGTSEIPATTAIVSSLKEKYLTPMHPTPSK